MSNDIVRDVYRTTLGNPTAKSILARLADSMNDDGFGWPSVQTIAAQTELSERQVLRVLQIFEEIGLVTRIRQRTPRYKYAFQLTRELLEKDLSDRFRPAFQHAQRKKGSVSETVKSVSETVKSVSETLPPHPLFGGTTNEPPVNHPQPPQGGGKGSDKATPAQASMRAQAVNTPGIRQAVDQVMQGCGFGRKRLRGVLASQVEQELSRGVPATTAALAMIAAWKDQQENVALLWKPYAVAEFFGDGHWRNRDTWRWKIEELREQARARVGMVQ